MKRISIVCLTGVLFFTACDNSGSSTVGTYEQEQTTQSSEKTESEPQSGQTKEKTETITTDTLKTTVPADENKTGTSASTDTSTVKP